MEFSIDKQPLVRALRVAARAAERKSPQPILSHILLRADDGKLLVGATDLTVSVAVTIEESVGIKKAGTLAVPATQVSEIVSALGGDSVHLVKQENNWLQITSGKSKFKLVGLAGADFPKLPDLDSVPWQAVDVPVLSTLFRKVVAAVSQDETRYHLCGALLHEVDGKIVAASTDGHRLHVSRAALDLRSSGLPDVGQALIPRRAVEEMRKLLDGGSSSDPAVGFGKGFIHLRVGGLTFSTKLLDAKFPPYHEVIPKAVDQTITVERKFLMEAVRRVSIVAPENGCIRLTVKKVGAGDAVMLIDVDNPDAGEAHETIEVDGYGGTKSHEFGLRNKYIVEALADLTGEKVKIGFSGPLDPVSFADGDDLNVVMPMRT